VSDVEARLPEARWVALALTVPEAMQDDLAGILGEDSLGVETSPARDGQATLRVFLPLESGSSARVDAAKDALRAHGLAPETCGLRLEPVADERWVERYHASLQPIAIGTMFLVIPGEPPESTGGRQRILLPPGQAFGTGEHETTRLCAEALERRVELGSVWADVGTGTGILAVVAVHCGASRVLACDVDPEAIDVAREVLDANAVADKVDLRLGSAEALPPSSADGIVANIEMRYFEEHARELAAALRPGGILLVSGFLRADVPQIVEVLGSAGLSAVEDNERGPWALVIAARASG
jgi:ribosomal protein L11 methyltransferase